MLLKGKRCIITGAASGIGAATAEVFAREGASLALIDREPAALSAVADTLRARGAKADAEVADVSDESELSQAIDRAVAMMGGLDSVFVNAGVLLSGEDRPLADLDVDAWHRTLRVNLDGAFLTAKHALRHLVASGGGAVVFTGSPTAEFGVSPGLSAYSSSKGGIHGLLRVAAVDYAPYRIRVNVVVPGFIHTAINDFVFQPGNEAELERYTALIPLGRAGEPSEVAEMVAFLSSDRASYVTGAFVHCDGGMTAV